MEPADKTENRQVKEIPPVPIKTYKWEDIRREKRRGKYPYTHLFKGSYEEFVGMEDDKPQNGEKKRKVRKVKKTSKVDDLSKKVEKGESQEVDKEKLLMEVEQITTTEEEITEIKLKELPKTPEPKSEEVEEPVIISEPKTDSNEPKIETQENLTIITETSDLSVERPMDEEKDIETILPNSDKLIVEPSKDDEQKEAADKMSIDASIDIVSKADSRNTESEDTYTESKIEEYLDKDVSKSVSDASGVEGTTSMSDIELPVDKPETPDIADKKRKHSSGVSEMTKSNLSLYEKLKNTKFKPPTFKIPKFKKFGFSKQGSKRAKTDKDQTSSAKVATETQTRRKSETPVYIYIPLKPSAEELEQERLERLKDDNNRRVQGTSEITNGNSRLNDVKDTNGTVSSTAPVIVGVKPKWKSFPSKTDKKSPPVKKKSKPVKKTSPKSDKKSSPTHKRSSPPVAKRSGDSPPVEYIHIPLNPTKEQLEAEWEEEFKKHVKQAERFEKIMRGEVEPDEFMVEDTSKGAIKKKSKEKKIKDPTSNIATDIKKFALKLKVVQKKTLRKSLGSKKGGSIKTIQKIEQRSAAKKSSPPGKKKGDSPQYIHIPLKGDEEKKDSVVAVKDNTEILDLIMAAQEQNKQEENTTVTNTDEKVVLMEETIETEITLEGTQIEIDVEKPNTPWFETEEKVESKPETTIEEIKESLNISEPTKIYQETTTSTPIVEAKPIEQPDDKKESIISKINIFKQRKPSPSRKEEKKEISKPEKENIKTKGSALPYPGMRRQDSIVEYIHIPLHPTKEQLEAEWAEEFKKQVKQAEAFEKQMRGEALSAEEELEIIKMETAQSDEPNKNISAEVWPNQEEPIEKIKSTTETKLEEKENKFDDIWSNEETPAEKETSIKLESKEVEDIWANEETSAEKETSKKVDDVEDIWASIEDSKKVKDKTDESTEIVKKDSKTKEKPPKSKKDTKSKIKEQAESEELKSNVEIKQEVKVDTLNKSKAAPGSTDQSKHEAEPKESIISKINIFKQRKPSPSRKEEKQKEEKVKEVKQKPIKSKVEKVDPSSTFGVRHKDSIVEYTHIPLSGTLSDVDIQKKQLIAELEEKIAEKQKDKIEPIEKEEPLAITPEPMETEDKQTHFSEPAEKSIETENVSEEVTNVELTEKPEDTKQRSPQDEQRIKSVEAILRQKSIKRKPPDTPPQKKSVANKFRQSFKVKSDTRSASEKQKDSPIIYKKKVDPYTKTISSLVRRRREDSVVEYIHIPLNPSEEQLAKEKEIEEKNAALQEKLKPKTAPVVVTSETVTKDTEEDPVKKGAIKKQPKEKKAKESSSSLAEDIKKFALKLKELQKKPKKPTFKTFRKGSKVGKKLSPTIVKKPLSSSEVTKKRDSPEYIFIPLKPTPEEIEKEKELELKKSSENIPISPEITPEEKPKDTIKKPDITKKETDTLSSTFKKTKEFSKTKLKEIKDVVQSVKDKKPTKKIEKVQKKVEIKSKQESPKSIPVQKETKLETEIVTTDESKEEIKPIEVDVKEEKKPEPDYEPIGRPRSMEDEEDGLKTPIVEAKPVEEQPLKSLLKTAESPKLHKKVSFRKNKKPSTEKQDSKDGDYEPIEVRDEPVDETRKEVQPESVDQKGTTPSLDDDHSKWSKSTDHEYEPINPPSDREAAAPVPSEEAPPPVHVTHITDLQKEEESRATSGSEQWKQPASLALQAEARLLRIPLDSELIVPSAETPEPDSGADRVSTPDTQATYLGTPTTTLSSRTEGISTSQVDSAALEHLPLKKESRKKKSKIMDEPDQPQGPNMQEKLKAQAGRLKTKIKSMKKPTFTIPNPKFSPKFKRPKFERPKFQKPKFERPKFQRPKFDTSKFSMPSMPSMPKMPDRANIKFPSFNLPASMRRQQRPAEDQPISTTDTSAESKKNIFDFRTYPRIFDRTKKKSAAAAPSSEETTTTPEFATVPRAAARKKGPVGARWVHRFTDIQFADDESAKRTSNGYNDELSSKDRGDSLERRMEADLRYEQALAEAEADAEMREYERENQNISRHSQYADQIEYSERWRHGSFRQPHPDDDGQEEIDLNRRDYDNSRDERSSVSSGHRGVIEEIDSDQFFLREKGISQDNIQVGLYLSSEIRDAFRQPANALSQMDNREYDLDASDISLPRPNRPKRKHLKKTKKVKKTPHASHEEISFDQESINTETEDKPDYKTYPPPPPKRNKRSKVLVKDESLDMSQASSLPIDDEINMNIENLKSQEDLPAGLSQESLQGNIIGYVEKDEDISEEYNKYIDDEALMYENEIMKNINQPEIVISADQKYDVDPKDVDRFLERSGMVGTPKPPTRRHRSIKSLNLSEHDSIMGEFNKDRILQDIFEQEMKVYRVEHEYIEPSEETPVAPVRRARSRSRASSQPDDDRTSRGAESFVTEEEECHEPPCQMDVRDAMGYAVIDKSQRHREPPLPSTPRRKRKSRQDHSPVDTKFFTVPRQLNDAPPPTRPTRNYSTLGPNRPPRRKSDVDLTQEDEEKENIDISQYIEIEDEDHNRDLQSGEVISKMKSRPLPAPPRPPRKTRDKSKEALRDITQQSNIIGDTIDEYDKTPGISPASPIEAVEEITVSTQTDPLPDDFCCDELIEEPTDRIVAPTRLKKSMSRDSSIPRTLERPKTPLERASSPHAMVIERRVHTPIEDETITHASLLVRPVPEYPPDSFVSKRFGADIPPEQSDYSEVSSERDLITESDSTLLPQSEETHFIEEPSILSTQMQSMSDSISAYQSIQDDISEQIPEIPEKPQRRKSQVQATSRPQTPSVVQPQIIERIIERQVPVCVTPGPDTEVELLRASRLQVAELDVEKLNVSELQASKILVSEIDGVSLQISELTSKSGNLVINGLDFPSGLIQEIIDRIQSSQHPEQQSPPSMEQVATQTSIEEPEPIDSNKFTESPVTEQVATQTSIEIPDELLKPTSEQVATQTSIELEEEEEEEEEESAIPAEYAELKRLQSLAFESTEDSIIPEEFAELKAMPSEYVLLSEKARLPSPTIVVDPPDPKAEPQPEPEEEHDEEHAAIKQIKDRIRFIEEEMSEFISEFSPDEVTEIKSEIDSIIEHVHKSRDTTPSPDTKKLSNEDINQLKMEVDDIIEEARDHVHTHINTFESNFHEPIQIFLPQWTPESIQTPDDMPGLTTETLFYPGEMILLEEDEEDDYPITPEEQAFIDLLKAQMDADTQHSETSESMITEDQTVIEQIEAQTLPSTDEQKPKAQDQTVIEQVEAQTTQTSESQTLEDKKKLQTDTKVIESKTETDETDSVIPKEFHELKSEQERIIETLQTCNIEVIPVEVSVAQEQTETSSSPIIPPRPPLPDQQKTDSMIPKEFHELKSEIIQTLTRNIEVIPVAEHEVSVAQEQESSSSPITPPRPPLPEQEHAQDTRHMQHPFSYYSEYMQHSVPPPGFYTLRAPGAQEFSEEDIPVHHKRRRHHRHLSRSRSSSDEDRRAASHSRRHATRSPEPSIPQLTGQLARACTYSFGRVLREVVNAATQHLRTREGKHDLQIALVILLVLIAGLILLGFGGGNTVHLHHWEYFNPPREL